MPVCLYTHYDSSLCSMVFFLLYVIVWCIVVDVTVYDIFLTHSHSKKRCCNYAVGYYMHLL